MRTLLLLLSLSASTALAAQITDNYFEVGFRLGVINYQGDLQKSLFTASGSRPALGGILRYSIGENFAVRGSLEIGSISADDIDNPELRERGFSFESNLLATEITAEYVPFGKERYTNGIFNTQINPYVFMGIGFVAADAEVTTTRPGDEALFPEADDRSSFFTVPIGAGVRASIISGLSVGLEANWRPTFDDYLDGVSVNGNSKKEDWFWTFGGYLTFTFGNAADDSMNLK